MASDLESKGDVCVVHLVWAPLGLDPFRAFVNSYRQHAAELPHRLLIVFNGFTDQPDLKPYVDLLDRLECSTLLLSRPAQDIAAYVQAARACTERWVCFLNSYSIIRCAGWLRLLHAPLAQGATRLAGASGSWESHPSDLRWGHRREPVPGWTPAAVVTRFLRWKERLGALARFPLFPNPHLRTNAFVIERALLLSLVTTDIRTKRQAHLFESGRNGLTARAVRAGVQPCVVDRQGRTWPQKSWPVSRTFRSGDQENLLVSDNRTRDYEQASPAARRVLSFFAWGSEEPV